MTRDNLIVPILEDELDNASSPASTSTVVASTAGVTSGESEA